MKITLKFFLAITVLSCLCYPIIGQKYVVDSKSSFDSALANAAAGDSIVWKSGTFSDIFMNIDKSNLYVGAEIPGETHFTGFSRVFISGDRVKMEGFQYLDGDIGTKHVIETRGSHNHFSHINIDGYTSYKYLIIKEESQYDTVSYCNFENRLNLDDQNILSILVDDTNPGYHLVQYCSFKNFDGTGNDLGIEPIRIGVSTQAEYNSRSIVEYCYFTQCNGDGEIISNKAGQNIFRYNTFENNPRAELVLRHGDQGVVYGNFFLNNYGGVRVREGQGHIIFNNYFHTTSSRTIYLQNEDSDPLKDINIAFNTIINCEEVRLGGNGNDKPENVTFANNIFVQPRDDLFDNPTGNETWISNITMGSLGMTKPDGITEIDPLLQINEEGYYELSEDSPAIDGAMSGYPVFPEFPGIQYDHLVDLDIMQQERPQEPANKDIGCGEFPHSTAIQPYVDEGNTGPSYLWDGGTSSINEIKPFDIQLFPNPAAGEIHIQIAIEKTSNLIIEILDLTGKKLKSSLKNSISSGSHTFIEDISGLNPGIYMVYLTHSVDNTGISQSQGIKFIKK